MLIKHDPDEWESVSTYTPCPYHKEHPRHTHYAGCTCSASYTMRRKQRGEK